MPDHLRADLDQLYQQAAKRPVFDFAWQSQPSKEITQVIGQHKQPQPHLIGDETFAGEPRPVQRIFTFLNPLLGGTAAMVEVNHAFWLRTHVGHDKSHPWE